MESGYLIWAASLEYRFVYAFWHSYGALGWVLDVFG